jgi:phosphatidylethanolamine/phosphatidyl-N-methylethanolamine N-methyltransferase
MTRSERSIADARLAAVAPGKGPITEAGQVVAAYSRWAPVYDLAFAAVMRAGRVAAAEAASAAAATAGGPAAAERRGRIIDIGVGTGLELPLFDPRTRILGIDLSEAMLRRARDRVRRDKLAHVEGLAVMDATRLAFPDSSFDVAVVPYVLTVVPEPHGMLDEVRRVVRRGGEIVLVNHFGAERGAVAAVEAWLGTRSVSLGWHPQFRFAILGDWIAGTPEITLLERRPVGPFGLFTLVRLRRH